MLVICKIVISSKRSAERNAERNKLMVKDVNREQPIKTARIHCPHHLHGTGFLLEALSVGYFKKS